jgi:hypothetical protein
MSGETRSAAQPTIRGVRRFGMRPLAVAVVAAVALLPIGAAAHDGSGQTEGHTLEVVLSYPDSGLADGEQLCLGLYPGDATDFNAPPFQARCLDPGDDAATFDGIDHGDFIVAVPGVGSEIERERYRGQLVETAIPDEPTLTAFGIEVDLALSPEAAGTTGRVQVNVYGCPPGTEGGGDADFWATECQALAGGIPLSLSGLGTIEHTEIEAVTGENGLASGRALFTDLPAGAYQLGGEIPENFDSPAVFIQSSIEGGIKRSSRTAHSISVRPRLPSSTSTSSSTARDTATVATSVDAGAERVDTPRTTILGFGDQQITGGLTDAEAASMATATAGE